VVDMNAWRISAPLVAGRRGYYGVNHKGREIGRKWFVSPMCPDANPPLPEYRPVSALFSRFPTLRASLQ
jgi:hypothetical protein